MRSSKHKPAPVPNLHFVIIVVTGVLIIISMLLYFFAPAGKAEIFASSMTLLLGFLSGKLSNQFGRPMRLGTATVDAVPDDEDEIPAAVAAPVTVLQKPIGYPKDDIT